MKTDLPEHVRRAIALGQGLPRETPGGRAAEAQRIRFRADPTTKKPDLRPSGQAPRAIRPQGRSKLQAAYMRDLEIRRHAGDLLAVLEERISLRLAERTWYRPDFLLLFPDGHLEIHEAKGHWEDDARVKIKVAAELHAWARFFAVTRRSGRDGFAGWDLEAIPGPRPR